jgi:tetratricopeptide (TPR) repeat protein
MKRTLFSFITAALLTVGCARSAPRPAGPPPGDPLGGVRAAELYKRGLAMAGGGDFVRAEQYLLSAVARGYPEDRVLPHLIRICVASSRLRSALRHAEPYLERNPDAWSLRYLVASLYLGVGDADRARESLEQVIADAPDQPDAYYLLGLVLRDEVGDRPAAAGRFARYLDLAPDGEHAAEVRAAVRALEAPRRLAAAPARKRVKRDRSSRRPRPIQGPRQAGARGEASP